MAPITPSPVSTSSSRPLRVLLTGFGPFKKVVNNPSWLVVGPLDATNLDLPPTSPLHATHPSIQLTAREIPTVFSSVTSLLPELHALDDWDLILHVGVGRPGMVKLEQRADRWGYENAVDHQGCHSPSEGSSGRSGAVGEEWGIVGREVDGREEVWTSVDAEPVLASLKKAGWEKVERSLDPGFYLCGFTTYCTTTLALKRASESGKKPVPVQFVHIPMYENEGSYTLEELREIVKIIVVAILESHKR